MNIRKMIVSVFLSFLVALPLLAQEQQETRRRVVVGGDEITVVEGDEDGRRVLVATRGGYLGVSTTNLTPELRRHLGASESGVLVAKVFEDTPAAKAGLRVGDVITHVDGKAVTSSWSLSRALRSREKGDQVALDYVRDRALSKTFVTLEERKGPLAWSVPSGEVPHLRDLEKVLERVHVRSNDPKLRARFAGLGECESLRDQITSLEKRLQELEKKLQK